MTNRKIMRIREQSKRWKKENPEKVKIQRIRYLDKKLRKRIEKNPKYLDKLKGNLLLDFDKLTRLLFKDKLKRECKNCGSKEDLHIHHKKYIFPIKEEDLVVLCRRCHVLEHQRINPKF